MCVLCATHFALLPSLFSRLHVGNNMIFFYPFSSIVVDQIITNSAPTHCNPDRYLLASVERLV